MTRRARPRAGACARASTRTARASPSMSVSRLASPAVALLVAACALAGAGCEARPRDNPLDPQNPMTGGGPIGFRALGGGDGVTLMWNPAPARADLIGFKLERRRTGPDDFEPLGPILPLQSTGTLDATALTDFDYDYRLSFVATDSSTSGAPALATARPGREVVWVADPAIDQIVPLTPAARPPGPPRAPAARSSGRRARRATRASASPPPGASACPPSGAPAR